MNRRKFLQWAGIVGAAAIAPTGAAVAAVLPDRRLQPFTRTHPDFAQPGSIIRSTDFRELAETVDALVEHVSR